MVDEEEKNVTEEKKEEGEGRITEYGDKSCPSCEEYDTKFKEKLTGSKHLEYEYVDVYSDRGQKKLEEMGVKPGEKIDVPIISVQKCTVEKDGQKKCGPEKPWKDSFWDKIEKDELPELE